MVDGSGNPWFYSDVLIDGDTIAEVSRNLKDKIGKDNQSEYEVIDATGKIVCPGFVDIHSHSDAEVYIDGTARSSVMQGITTEIVGNCGDSAFPMVGFLPERFGKMIFEYYGWTDGFPWTTLEEYLNVISFQGISVNIGVLAGHGSIRTAVSDYADRPLTESEWQQCERLLKQAMEHGAFGMSLGLAYAPGSYAATDEIVKFSEAVAEYNGLVACHLRSESADNVGLLAALQEMLTVARESGARVQISHMKCSGPGVWGLGDILVRMVEDSRQRGLDIAGDQYPYSASSSSVVSTLVPRWAQAGTKEDFLARLNEPALREKIKEAVVRNLVNIGGPDRLVMGRYPPKPEYAGKSLAEISEILGLDPAETTLKVVEPFNPQSVCYSMQEDDVQTIMKAPFVMVGSDGRAQRPEGILSNGPPHPRSFGAFPRVLSKYVLQNKVLSLEEAIRKMTSLPAARLNITDRGYVKQGFKADIVVFDPVTIKDNATFESPRVYPSGIDHVLVNGVPVVAEGKHTEAKPGIVLRHSV